jgi:hypothetical protein
MPAVLRPVFILDIAPAAAVTVSPTNVDFTATAPLVLVDCHNVATATQGGGTAQLFRQALGSGGFSAMTTAALAMDTTSALTRTTTVVAAQRTVSPTDVIRGVFTTVNTNGNLYGHMVMTPITGA